MSSWSVPRGRCLTGFTCTQTVLKKSQPSRIWFTFHTFITNQSLAISGYLHLASFSVHSSIVWLALSWWSWLWISPACGFKPVYVWMLQQKSWAVFVILKTPHSHLESRFIFSSLQAKPTDLKPCSLGSFAPLPVNSLCGIFFCASAVTPAFTHFTECSFSLLRQVECRCLRLYPMFC